jgi:pyruvate formate-lyase activating enzyme-like uncharacterized protein
MNENILDFLNATEESYKGKFLEALLEAKEYFEDTPFEPLHEQWLEMTRDFLFKLQKFANKNELFESNDNIQALLDLSK